MKRGFPRCRRMYQRRQGMALLVVVVIVMLLALAAYGFNQQMTDSYQRSQLEIERAQARQAALSGVELLLAFAELPRKERYQQGDGQMVALQGVEVEASLQQTASEEDLWSFTVFSGGTNQGSDGIKSESAKLNVAVLKVWEAMSPGHAKRALMNLPGADEAVVDAWLDKEGIVAGALLSGGSPMRPSTLERMEAKVGAASGVDFSPQQRWAELWTGGDWNCNYRLDPLELALAEGEVRGVGIEQAGSVQISTQQVNSAGSENGQFVAWRDYLTYYSGERNESAEGKSRIFLNAVNLQELHQQLVAAWGEAEANFVIAARQYGLRVSSSPGSASGPSGTSYTPDFSRPGSYLLKASLDLVGAAVDVPGSDGKTMVLNSPFAREKEPMRNYLGRLIDETTVDPNEVIEGQIDIISAPREVLLGIPGIQPSQVERILERRKEALASTGERSLAWLVHEDVIGWDEFVRLQPWMTVGGDCYSGQVIGFRDATSAVYRCTVIIDGRSDRAVIRDLQEWHAWGRGFTDAELRGEELAD